MKDKVKIRFLGIFSILVLCIGVTIKELQNDTFYIIKLGEFIRFHGIDFLDHWSWIPNLSYTYPHWLYDLLIYMIYDGFGFQGVYVSSIFFFILFIFLIYLIHLKVNQNEFMALFLSIISIACLYVFATARAQLLTAILFFLEVFVIEKLLQSGEKKYIFVLSLFSLLIANLHATIWMFFFILYLPFIGEHIVYKIRKGKSIHERLLIGKITYFRELIGSMVLSFFMGVFTPSRICYSYIFKIMLGDSQTFISEHASLIVIQHPCFLVFVLILLIILIFSFTKIKLRELFMVAGLILMCLVSVRHLIFFYTIGLFYISRICIRYLEEKKDKTLDILGRLLVSNNVVYFIVIVVFGVFSYFQFEKNQMLDYVNKKEYPVLASSFIKENLDVSNIRLYNNYNYGSYLMFEDIPVFIDSRCDLYLKEFNHLSYSIFDDEMGIASSYQEKFEFYDFTHILVLKENILYQILRDREAYSVLYQDKYFILFERLELNEEEV